MVRTLYISYAIDIVSVVETSVEVAVSMAVKAKVSVTVEMEKVEMK